MTERLYYHDPYLREFDATVVEQTTHEGKTALVLDRTAFYPTSGGQPFDAGTLSGVQVLDVVDTDDGRILHVVDRAPDGTRVTGAIDWTRRFDHMQQHTGQHVLSAAFDRLLERADGELPPRRRVLDDRSGARAVCRPRSPGGEDEANRVVWEDRPVAIRFAGPEEIASAAAPEGTQARRDAAPDRRPGLRPLRLRRHARGAHRGDRHRSPWRPRNGSAADRGSRSCAAGARSAGYRSLRDAVAGSVRALSVLPAELPARDRAAAGGRQGSAQADQGLPVEARGPGGRRAGGRARSPARGRPGSWRRRSRAGTRPD